MKGIYKLFIYIIGIITVSLPGVANARGLEQFCEAMSAARDYRAEVVYKVFLPQAEDPVAYSLRVESTAAGDSLSPCRYLIDWQLPLAGGDGGVSTGFSAYGDGHLYRYRDGRLQEYHTEWDSLPFMTGGGVQRNTQFADVLPQFLGAEIKRLSMDPAFKYRFTADTLYRGRPAACLEGKLEYGGVTSREMLYVFDPETMMPREVVYENNPGGLGEQSVTISYAQLPSSMVDVSEEALMGRYADVFGRLRESNFKIENMPGTLLPAFSLPLATGEGRLTHHRGETLGAPMVILFLDGNAPESSIATIEAVREGAGNAPRACEVVLAFVSNNPDAARELAEQPSTPPLPEERIVTGARGLVRECGVTAYPTLLYVDAAGMVRDVTLGYNKELPAVVIQKVSSL